MARQKLINYHSSGTTAPLPANIEHGEIAVQYSAEDSALYIKDSDGNLKKFIESGAVQSMIDNSIIDCGFYYIPQPVVDLGLPSGTLWYEYNIGASTPYESGLYFAWGEISGYTAAQVGVDKSFSSSFAGYRFGNPPSKYNSSDGKTTLENVDDAANIYLGNEYKIPTKENFEELLANTTSAITQINGVYGLLLTSTVNMNTLFFPAAGYCYNSRVSGATSKIRYISSSLNTSDVQMFYMFEGDSGGIYIYGYYRYCGMPIRPIVVQNQ